MDKVTYNTTKEDILSIAVPGQTRTWKPVSNERLIDTTLNSIVKSGFTLDSESYSKAQNGMQTNGKYTIRNVADNEMQLQIAWQNSYNKSLSLKFATGINVFICSNGACVGDIGNFKKKHVGTIEEFSIQHIGEYIKTAQDTFEQMQKDRERMKEIEMTKRTTAELLGRMFIEDEIITSTQLGIIKRELIKPTFDYMAKDSLWEVYNHATYAFKEEHPALWLKRHIGLHDYIMNKEIGQVDVTDVDFTILSPEEMFDNLN